MELWSRPSETDNQQRSQPRWSRSPGHVPKLLLRGMGVTPAIGLATFHLLCSPRKALCLQPLPASVYCGWTLP